MKHSRKRLLELLAEIPNCPHCGAGAQAPSGEDDVVTTFRCHACGETWRLSYELSVVATPKIYDPDYGDDRVCECGHTYYRHFDSYEDMDPIGCKYCDCDTFREAK